MNPISTSPGICLSKSAKKTTLPFMTHINTMRSLGKSFRICSAIILTASAISEGSNQDSKVEL